MVNMGKTKEHSKAIRDKIMEGHKAGKAFPRSWAYLSALMRAKSVIHSGQAVSVLNLRCGGCDAQRARDPKISSRRQTHERPRLARGEEGEGGGASCSVFSHKPRDPEEVPSGWVTWSSPNEEESLRLALGLQHFYFSINAFSASRNETAAFCFTRLDRGRGGTHEERRRRWE
ncbi:hypothetical protein MHYP_G00250420 [Metynnis hypsauchen]